MTTLNLSKFLQNQTINIITEPDERLRYVSSDYIENNLNDLHNLKKIMYKLMIDSHGIGLAAPQIGLNLNIILVNLKNEDNNIETLMVNPKIVSKSGKNSISERCLSVPGKAVCVNRSLDIEVEFLDEQMIMNRMSLTGINSICVQHEIDHLFGITISQYEQNL